MPLPSQSRTQHGGGFARAGGAFKNSMFTWPKNAQKTQKVWVKSMDKRPLTGNFCQNFHALQKLQQNFLKLVTLRPNLTYCMNYVYIYICVCVHKM